MEGENIMIVPARAVRDVLCALLASRVRDTRHYSLVAGAGAVACRCCLLRVGTGEGERSVSCTLRAESRDRNMPAAADAPLQHCALCRPLSQQALEGQERGASSTQYARSPRAVATRRQQQMLMSRGAALSWRKRGKARAEFGLHAVRSPRAIMTCM